MAIIQVKGTSYSSFEASGKVINSAQNVYDDLVFTIDLRGTPKINVQDNLDYGVLGWDINDVVATIILIGPHGTVYSNEDYNSPDIIPATSRFLNKTIELPLDPVRKYENILKGNYTLKVSWYNSVKDEYYAYLNTYGYQFEPPEISNTAVSGPYTGTLKSTDTTEYGSNVFTIIREHRIHYPTQLNPVPDDIVSSNQEIQVTPIYTNEWNIDISSYVEYHNPDTLRILWEGEGSFTHCVYGGCISAMYEALNTMLENYYEDMACQTHNQEAYQKRLVTVNTAWHLLNVAYINGDAEEADNQAAIIHEQVAYTGSGTCGGATSEPVTACPPYSGSEGVCDCVVENGLSKDVNGHIRIGGILVEPTTVNIATYKYSIETASGGYTVYNRAEYNVGAEMGAGSVTTASEIKALTSEVQLNYLDISTPANSKYYNIDGGGLQEGADYSGDYTLRSLVSKEYVDNLNDWGTQVVVSDTTLTGDGTAGSPLAVTTPFPGFTDLPTDYGYTPPTTWAWGDITGTPTTISGYGITDAYTKTELQTSLGAQVHWDNLTNVPAIGFPGDFVPTTGGTFTGAVTFATSTDRPITLQQVGTGGSAGTPEAGTNFISFRDGDGDEQGIVGIDASGRLYLTTNISGGYVYVDSDLSVNGDIIVSGLVDGVDISVFKAAYDAHTHAFSEITSTPTTLSGYGITDAMLNTDNSWSTEFTVKASATTSDYIVIEDAADSNKKKYVLISNLPTSAATFDALTDTPSVKTGQGGDLVRVNAGETALEYVDISSLYISTSAGTLNSLTEKVTPVNADVLIIEDSANSYNQKKILISNLPSTGGGTGSGIAIDYKFDSVIAKADPGAGKFRMNNATIANITEIYVNDTAYNTVDMSTVIEGIRLGDTLYIQQFDTSTKSALFTVISDPIDETGYYTISVTYVDDGGTIPDNNANCGFMIEQVVDRLTFSQSLLKTGESVTLTGDTATPGNSKYYGTDGTGTRGYFDFPTVSVPAHASTHETGGVDEVNHDNLVGFVQLEHVRWDITGAEDVHVDRISSLAVTQHEGDINHNNLLNTHNLTSDINHDLIAGYVIAEHIDWTVTGAETIHLDRLTQFSSTASGIVPASGGGVTNFLRADGTWTQPSGSGSDPTIAVDGLTVNTSTYIAIGSITTDRAVILEYVVDRGLYSTKGRIEVIYTNNVTDPTVISTEKFGYGDTGVDFDARVNGDDIELEIIVDNSSATQPDLKYISRIIKGTGQVITPRVALYISNAGNDSNDGETALTPWATISKLNEKIALGNIDVPVYLRRGDSWNEAIDFDGHDSITIGAYGTGDLPEITGKKTLTGTWTETSAGSHIWYLTDSTIVGNIRYLYSNGVKMNIAKTSIVLADSNGTTTTIVDTTNLSGATDNYNGAELYARPKTWRWDGGSVVTGYNATTHTLTFSPSISYSLLSGQGYFMQNSLDILTANATQGEWIHDKAGNFGTADRIYMYSISEPSTLAGDITVSSVETVIKLDNSDHITLKDLKVSHTNGNAITNNANTSNYLTINGLEFEDVICPVWVRYAESSSFTNINIINAGSQGIFIQDADNSHIDDNVLRNIGLVKSEGYYNPSSAMKLDTKHVGLYLRASEGCSVKRNNIQHIGTNGISLIDIDTSVDCRYNYITNVGRTGDDVGGIYVWGSANVSSSKLVRDNVVIGDWTGSLCYEGRGTYATTGEYLQGYDVCGIYIDGYDTDYYTVEDNIAINNYLNIVYRSDHNIIRRNKTALAHLETGYDNRWRPAEIARHVELSYSAGSYGTCEDNEFIGLWDDNRVNGQISPGLTVYTHTDIISDATDWFDRNIHQMPFGNKSGYTDDIVMVYSDSNQFQTLEEWKAHTAIVGKHSTGTVMPYSITGLSDIYDMIWYQVNETGSTINVTFPSGYRYYTTAGNEISSDTIPAYGAKIYFRTIDEPLPAFISVEIVEGEGNNTTIFLDTDSTVTNPEDTYLYQWYIVADDTQEGRVKIPGATSATYKALATDGFDGTKYLMAGVIRKVMAGGNTTLLTGVEQFSQRVLIQQTLNLLTNSGGDDTTDWINPTAGVAEDWVVNGGAGYIASIVTGNGFTGNAQRVEFSDSSGYVFLEQSIAGLEIGKTYDIDLMSRSNVDIKVIMDGTTTALTATSNTGNATKTTGSFVATATDHLFRIYFTPTNPDTNDWFEVDEINFKLQ